MRKYIGITALPLILIACTSPDGSLNGGDDSSLPNIILLVSDDHGTDALGCYGNPVVHTPNLDGLAHEGVRFTNAYCTSASCSASRSVILTGRFNHAIGHYGHEHEYHHFRTFDTVMSLPLYLEAAGYHTARIGKYHLAPESVYYFQEVLACNPRSTIEMAEKTRGVINGKKPFFLYFCFDDPHRGHPFQSDPWYLPNNFGNIPGGYPGETVMTYSAEEVIVPPFLPDTKETREELAEYYQSVARIDQGVGRLLQILEEAGKKENTVIIYISDNGIAFPGAKTTLYDPGIRLPLIVWAPWIQTTGVVNNAMVTWADLTPTILNFAGIDPEMYYFHGKSFKDVLDEESPEGWDKIYASHTFHEVTMYYPMRVVQDRQYKLIWNIAWQLPYPFASDLWAASTWQGIHRAGKSHFGKRTIDAFINRSEFELYDMVNDPHEVVNLAEKPAYSGILETMKDQIRQFQLRTRDPWIIMWDNESVFQGTGVNL
jgi:N-sulfoglucosamine sulfohydrolase